MCAAGVKKPALGSLEALLGLHDRPRRQIYNYVQNAILTKVIMIAISLDKKSWIFSEFMSARDAAAKSSAPNLKDVREHVVRKDVQVHSISRADL